MKDAVKVVVMTERDIQMTARVTVVVFKARDIVLILPFLTL